MTAISGAARAHAYISAGVVLCNTAAPQPALRRKDKALAHTRPVTMLEGVKQVSSLLWPYLFNRQPDAVERDDAVRDDFVLPQHFNAADLMWQ
jgi:hypothetical protein